MNKTPLHICFFGTYDQTYTSNMLTLTGLRANGAKVTEVNAHIKVTTLNKQEEMGWLPLIKRVLKKYRIIKVITENWSVFPTVDVIYVGYPGHFDVFFAYLLGKIFNKKVVFNPLLIFYTGFVDEQKILKKEDLLARIIKWGESLIYKMVDLAIADTPYQESYMINEFHVPKEKIKCVPIGADDTVYKYTPYTNTTGHKLNVMYYGLYSPIHGVQYLMQAALRLKKNKDIHFTMVGNGQSFQKNYDFAQKENLTNIQFYHNTPESEHVAILQTADVFLGFLEDHPTVERVIPNKVYQGVALGKVVLTADAPVIRSVFTDHQDIMTIKPASVDALVNALEELSQKPELRTKIARAGYELYSQQFTSKAVGKMLITYMTELVKK